MGGGILLPGTPPGSGLEPTYSARYEPIWSACEAAGPPINHHSGSAVPAMATSRSSRWSSCSRSPAGPPGPVAPHLQRGDGAPPGTLSSSSPNRGRPGCPRPWAPSTSSGTGWATPWAPRSTSGATRSSRACRCGRASTGPQRHVGSSFMRPAEAALRHAMGLNTIMWGSDYPHKKSSFPSCTAARPCGPSFASVDPAEVQRMVGTRRGSTYALQQQRSLSLPPRRHRPSAGPRQGPPRRSCSPQGLAAVGEARLFVGIVAPPHDRVEPHGVAQRRLGRAHEARPDVALAGPVLARPQRQALDDRVAPLVLLGAHGVCPSGPRRSRGCPGSRATRPSPVR